MSEFTPAPIPDGKTITNGNTYMTDTKGRLTPIELIKPQHLLEDETVRKIMGFMIAASDQITRLKQHTFEDISAYEAILDQEYGATVGGEKGNKTLMSYDGLFKISVAVQDYVTFGPELQTAKKLIDECLTEWSADANAPLRAIVTDAFRTDKEGQINRSQIFTLKRQDIQDDRWKRAMQAINDAMKVVGSKTYVRAYKRERIDAGWEAVTIDMAKA